MNKIPKKMQNLKIELNIGIVTMKKNQAEIQFDIKNLQILFANLEESLFILLFRF